MVKKFSMVLLAVGGLVNTASALDIANLKCGDMQVYKETTLGDVQNNCLLVGQDMINGLFEVTFVNTATSSKVTCVFPDRDKKSQVNSCR